MKHISHLLLLIIIAFVSCSNTTITSNNQQIIGDSISIIRFDKDLYSYLENPTISREKELKEKYPSLLPAFYQTVINKKFETTNLFPDLKEYFSHPALMKIYKDALSNFENVSAYEEELNNANLNIKEHLNGRNLPELCMHVSGFKENVIILDNMISISIDKYLGENYQAYRNFFQLFERQQMEPKYITRDYIKAWLLSEIINDKEEMTTLINEMIYQGKILYTLSLILPEYRPNELIGYTMLEENWCKQNEKKNWQQLVSNNYLFTSDHMIITRFINDAPYTSPIGKDSPGKIGSWIGWQIIKQYANKTGETLLQVLSKDPLTILKESKYNP